MGYEIRFWREVTNSHGHPFRVVLARFAVNQDNPSERTKAQATAAFCRMMHVDRWGLVAHGYDVAEMDEVAVEGEPCLIADEAEDALLAHDTDADLPDADLPVSGAWRPAQEATLGGIH